MNLIKLAEGNEKLLSEAHSILSEGENKIRGYVKKPPFLRSVAVSAGLMPNVMGSGPKKVERASSLLEGMNLEYPKLDSARAAGSQLYKNFSKEFPGAIKVESAARKIGIIPKTETGEQAMQRAAGTRYKLQVAMDSKKKMKVKPSTVVAMKDED